MIRFRPIPLLALSFVALAFGAACPPRPGEISGNGQDDDDHDLSDCNDELCGDFEACIVVGACPVVANPPSQPTLDDNRKDLAPVAEVQGFLCPQFDDDGFRVGVPDPVTIILVSLSMDTNLTQIEPGYSLFI